VASSAELYELQKTDTLWEQVRRRLIAIRKKLGESDEVLAAREQATATEADLHAWHGRQTDAELESRSLKGRIADTEKRLMDGSVSNPKELEALQASLDALKRQRASVEEKAVAALLQVEELTKRLEAEQTRLAELEDAWRTSQSDLLAAEEKMKRNFVILKRRREAAAAAMDPESLASYEHLRKRKGGVAVAEVQDSNCSACYVQLPTGTLSALAGNGHVTCPSCGRLLYKP
jgi:predicted  nucleic acid-binding Zn-ribbon protein